MAEWDGVGGADGEGGCGGNCDGADDGAGDGADILFADMELAQAD